VFHAYENSEDADRMAVLRTLFDQPGLHIYPFVEVPLNTYLFHMDVAPAGELSRWQRFIFDNIQNVFDFTRAENLQEFRIYVQSPRGPNVDYRLLRVVEISKATAITGEDVYKFSYADGSTAISGLNELTDSDIADVSTLWREPSIDE
jgi:hypothetical protein